MPAHFSFASVIVHSAHSSLIRFQQRASSYQHTARILIVNQILYLVDNMLILCYIDFIKNTSCNGALTYAAHIHAYMEVTMNQNKFVSNVSQPRSQIRSRKLAAVGMSAAVISVLAQIALPIGPVPVTLQTFALALTACVLGPAQGFAAALIYLLCGAVGLPVFAGFSGGPSALFGYSGGFLWAFPVMSLLCGFSCRLRQPLGLLPCLAGLLICHLGGTLQYCALAGVSFGAGAMAVSVPYLLKDVLSVMLALYLAAKIRTALLKSGLL